jgi:hypothetical protein
MRPLTARMSCPVLQRFCESLAPGAVPVRLAVLEAPHARPLDCFESVARHVILHGGRACYGWQLWEWPSLFLEAEFHAVWRNPSDALHDITPKPEPVHEILFLPDPARAFEGRRVNNVRVALSEDPHVREFLQACDDEWLLLNRGARAALRTYQLAAEEVRELERIRARKASLGVLIGMQRVAS